MSESGHHRSLVLALTNEISIYHGRAFSPIIYCDVQDELINDLPPIIGGNRPDVFAHDIRTSMVIIGEAKTSNDIDNSHTLTQLDSFFAYLRNQPGAEFWMAVPWLSAGTAMRVCSHARKKSDALHIPIRVFAFMIGNLSHRRIWCE